MILVLYLCVHCFDQCLILIRVHFFFFFLFFFQAEDGIRDRRPSRGLGDVYKRQEYILKNAVDYIRDDYDFIIIDCPPSLNMLTVNAMTTADTVLVPIQCEYYALEGISQLIHTIDLVQERLNPDLKMEGVVFTMYDSRTNLSNEVVDNVKNNLHTTIYKTIIPRNVRLAEAPSHGLPINLYDSRSAGAESYRLLAKEVIDREDI